MDEMYRLMETREFVVDSVTSESFIPKLPEPAEADRYRTHEETISHLAEQCGQEVVLEVSPFRSGCATKSLIFYGHTAVRGGDLISAEIPAFDVEENGAVHTREYNSRKLGPSEEVVRIAILDLKSPNKPIRTDKSAT